MENIIKSRKIKIYILNYIKQNKQSGSYLTVGATFTFKNILKNS